MTKKALLVLDVINELLHQDGSVGKDGFYQQALQRNILKNLRKVISSARKKNVTVIYVVFGFYNEFSEWSANSKLFRNVKERQQAILGTWSTAIHREVAPENGEYIVTKHRIDPFFNTNLEMILRINKIEEVFLSGVSSEFVVLATALSAHDRDYKVQVIEDCISSSSQYSHNCAVHIINKVADITTSSEVTFK